MTTWHLYPSVKHGRWAPYIKNVWPFQFCSKSRDTLNQQTNIAAHSGQHGNEILAILITVLKFNINHLKLNYYKNIPKQVRHLTKVCVFQSLK